MSMAQTTIEEEISAYGDLVAVTKKIIQDCTMSAVSIGKLLHSQAIAMMDTYDNTERMLDSIEETARKAMGIHINSIAHLTLNECYKDDQSKNEKEE